MATKLQKVEGVLNRMNDDDLVSLYNATIGGIGYPKIHNVDNEFNDVFSSMSATELVKLVLQSDISLGKWKSAKYCALDEYLELYNDGREAIEQQVSMSEMAAYIIEQDDSYGFAELEKAFADEE